MVMGAMYDLRGGVVAAAGVWVSRVVAAASGVMVGAVGGGLGSSPGEPRIGIVQPFHRQHTRWGFRQQRRPSASSAGGLGGAKGGVHIPSDTDWVEPVVIHEDDNLAKRIITERMNCWFAVVKLPRDCVIVDTAANAGRRGERAYMTINGFRTDQQRFPCVSRATAARAKKSKEANRADIWLSSPYRREYDEWGLLQS